MSKILKGMYIIMYSEPIMKQHSLKNTSISISNKPFFFRALLLTHHPGSCEVLLLFIRHELTLA